MLGTASSSWWHFGNPFSLLWRTQAETPKASMSAFAVSLNNGIAQFKTGMSSFNTEDQQLNGNQIAVSYIFKSVAEDLTAAFSFSNQKELPARLKLSVPLTMTFNFQGAPEDIHERIYNFIHNHNKSQKETHTFIKIQDSKGHRNLTTVDILLKGYVSLKNPNDLEQELTTFNAAAEKVKESFEKVIKGQVIPTDDNEGFIIVSRDNKALKSRRKPTAAVASSSPPINLTADIINTKRTKFETIVGVSAPSPFASEYAFKLQEQSVVNAKFTTADKTKYVFYQGVQMRVPSRSSQLAFAGYRQFAERTRLKPEGELLLKQDLKTGDLIYNGRNECRRDKRSCRIKQKP